MVLIVKDKKGIAYSDNKGRQVIGYDKELDPSLIDKGFFRKTGIDVLLSDGRLGKSKTDPDYDDKLDKIEKKKSADKAAEEKKTAADKKKKIEDKKKADAETTAKIEAAEKAKRKRGGK